MDGKRIKPFVDEISLAFNPANKKKFILMKEADMQELVEILMDGEELVKEKEIDAALKELSKTKKISDKAAKGMKGVLKILGSFKDDYPAGILSSLAKLVPEHGSYVDADGGETAAEKKKKEDAVKKLKKDSYDEGYAKAKEDLSKDHPDVKDLKKEVDDLKKELEKANDTARVTELTKQVTEIGVLSEPDKHARVIFSLEKINKETAEEYIERLKKEASMLKASGLFGEIGSDGAPVVQAGSKDAYDKLMAKVTQLKKDVEGISDSDAYRRAAKENPELYRQYTEGRKKEEKDGS